MKQKELIKKLKSIGFDFYRHGGSHDIYRRGKVGLIAPQKVNNKLGGQ